MKQFTLNLTKSELITLTRGGTIIFRIKMRGVRLPMDKKIVMKHGRKSEICIYCNSSNTIKQGLRYNIGRGRTQKFTCKDCGKKFSEKHADYRMRNNEVKIKTALELRKQGLSLSQVAKKVGGVSRQTILKWEQKYEKTNR